MNPFVNPKKRSISLPNGCKDLVDVLKRSESKHDGAIRRFIHLVLVQAQQDQATELVIGVASPSGGTPIRYKIEDAWYDMSPFPSHVRPDVISELVRMAKFHAGEIPGEGVLDEICGDVRLRWIIAMTSADGECMLVRVQD
jgi:type II secretory ATPase GspE/PulE/Tfp pilus assembly ATPase PilB-like protein